MNREQLAIGPSALPATLCLPASPRGLVLLAHCQGCESEGSRAVAEALHPLGLATLSFDLLTPQEAARRANIYNVGLLAHRVLQAMDEVRRRPELHGLRVGLYGAGTAASAALVCAAERPQSVQAVVSRAGRTELALEVLDRVRAPTLLIAAGADRDVLQLNYDAYRQLRCAKQLEIVPQATCAFEEPGAGPAATDMLVDWFARHLPAPALQPSASQEAFV